MKITEQDIENALKWVEEADYDALEYLLRAFPQMPSPHATRSESILAEAFRMLQKNYL